MTLDDEKSELLSEAARHTGGRTSGGRRGGAAGEAVLPQRRRRGRHRASAEDLYGALASHVDLAASRPQGTACVRVATPVAEDGWSAGGHSVVRGRHRRHAVPGRLAHDGAGPQHRDVQLVIHPQMDVVRDITGELQPSPASRTAGGAEGAIRESWMHIEMTRSATTRTGRHRGGAPAGARDVRGGRGLAEHERRGRRIAAVLGTDPPPLSRDEVAPGQELLQWLARTTTSRSSATASTASRPTGRTTSCAPCPAPGSASCAPTRTAGARQAAGRGRRQGAREDPAGPREGQLAGDRAPAGLPRLRRRQDVRRRTARWSASSASSACSPARPTPSR